MSHSSIFNKLPFKVDHHFVLDSIKTTQDVRATVREYLQNNPGENWKEHGTRYGARTASEVAEDSGDSSDENERDPNVQ